MFNNLMGRTGKPPKWFPRLMLATQLLLSSRSPDPRLSKHISSPYLLYLKLILSYFSYISQLCFQPLTIGEGEPLVAWAQENWFFLHLMGAVLVEARSEQLSSHPGSHPNINPIYDWLEHVKHAPVEPELPDLHDSQQQQTTRKGFQ